MYEESEKMYFNLNMKLISHILILFCFLTRLMNVCCIYICVYILCDLTSILYIDCTLNFDCSNPFALCFFLSFSF